MAKKKASKPLRRSEADARWNDDEPWGLKALKKLQKMHEQAIAEHQKALKDIKAVCLKSYKSFGRA